MRPQTKSLLFVLLLAGCTGAGEAPAPNDAASTDDAADGRVSIPSVAPDIRGVVTAAEAASLRVEANPAESSGSPKAVVRLTPETVVAYRNGDAAAPEDLTVGHNVSVWFTGPVMESYPVQATALAVVIEPIGAPPPPAGAL